MKNSYLSLFFNLIFTICSAQKLSDKFEYKVTYKLTYKLDSTNLDDSKSEYMILYTGDELSKFSSRAKTLANPIVRKGNTAHTSRAAVTDFQYVILKNRSENKLFFTRNIAGDKFYYTQKMDQFKWEILPEKKKIKDFEVQKAKTSFAGRDYVAWFTSEIPISEGPYKFNRLPGLIVKIADEDEYCVFELIGFKSLTAPVFDTEINKDSLEVDKARLKEIKEDFNANPLASLERLGISFGFKPGQREKMKKEHEEKLKKRNNPIELE